MSMQEKVKDILGRFCEGKRARPITGSTRPISGLGLESRDGLEFACAVDLQLGVYLPDDVNPFVDSSGDKPRERTVAEIAALVHSYKTEGEDSDARPEAS